MLTTYYIIIFVVICLIGYILYRICDTIELIANEGIHETTSFSIPEESIQEIAKIVIKTLQETYGIEIEEENDSNNSSNNILS